MKRKKVKETVHKNKNKWNFFNAMKYISATKIMLNKETLGTLTDSIRVTNKNVCITTAFQHYPEVLAKTNSYKKTYNLARICKVVVNYI